MSNQVLSCENVKASYGAIQALHGVNLEVNEGEIVVVLGANGAGKTTTLRAICNMVATEGTVMLNGSDISKADTADIVNAGVAHVPQGRGTFAALTVLALAPLAPPRCGCTATPACAVSTVRTTRRSL